MLILSAYKKMKFDLFLPLSILLAIIINFPLSFSNFYELAVDSYIHIFFSTHYAQNWFELWEPRWYTGFSVASYPPLTHQILSLLSFLLGKEGAYQMLTFIVMITLPISVYFFVSSIFSKRAAGIASLLILFPPLLYIDAYSWGQLPTLLSLQLGLLSARYLRLFLIKDNVLYGIASVFLFSSCVSSHHLTGIFFLPLFYITIALYTIVEKKGKIIKRSIITIVIAFSLSMLTISPFVFFILSSNVQTPIWHYSRASFFTTQVPIVRRVTEFLQLIFIVPTSTILVLKLSKQSILIYSLAIFFFLLGLGGTTPIPQILFGSAWQWLTYERFELWAILIFSFLTAVFLDKIRFKKNTSWYMVLTVFLLLYFLSSFYSLSLLNFGMWKRFYLDVEPVAQFLNSDEHWKWRYITLGFGDNMMAKLSTMTNASSVDGNYHTGRPLKILRSSGIGVLDLAKYFPNGTYVLEKILENAKSYGLRYVFSIDKYYDKILNEKGFKIIRNLSNNVVIWEKDDVPMPKQIEKSSKIIDRLFGYIWGIAPLSSLLLGFTSLAWGEVRKKRNLKRRNKI